MTISKPNTTDFDFIKDHISKFELDNRDLQEEQFLIAKSLKNEVLAFGRIRKHKGCDELCSLGVVEKERLKGIGHLLSNDLIKNSQQPLYLVCIIPQFFEPLGFKIVKEYPLELKDKVKYCRGELAVPEEYVVMKYLT
ncbi:MAG: hypothetical protein H0U95_10540 [Bacteroidetes bacterium]|nr:hypothetical protein [Bacteroidota bacterium]